VPAFTKGVFLLADRMIGALIIIERNDLVEELITGGRPLNGDPGPELLMSIFQKESPLHDGAVLIRDSQVTTVSCYLPLSSTERLPSKWGTRHRAALGLAERCDAWVVTVSEENGEVSLAQDGQMTPVDNKEKFSQAVLEAITPLTPQKTTWTEMVRSLLIRRWHVKVGCLALVSLLWLLLAGQQDFQVEIRVPLELKNTPSHMEILKPLTPEVRITARGLRRDASSLSEKNVHVELDLSMARLGRKDFSITRDQILLPNDRIQVVRIEPSRMEFEFKDR